MLATLRCFLGAAEAGIQQGPLLVAGRQGGVGNEEGGGGLE